MAEDILHDELGEGDRVLITHEGDEEELSFEIKKGEAPTETTDEPKTNGEAEASTEDEVTDDSQEEASAAASDEEE